MNIDDIKLITKNQKELGPLYREWEYTVRT